LHFLFAVVTASAVCYIISFSETTLVFFFVILQT
jgi:hypothetical protein